MSQSEETLADQEVVVIEATPTPHVPLIGGDYNNVQFGPGFLERSNFYK
jgi:hypothetical protein